MADRETIGYTKYYKGSCLVKFEKSWDDYYLTEIKVDNGRVFLVTTKNDEEIVEKHELGIIDVKPIDLNIGIYGQVKEEN